MIMMAIAINVVIITVMMTMIMINILTISIVCYAYYYGQFSKFQIFFCGLDPGNLKFETVRTNKQRICF